MSVVRVVLGVWCGLIDGMEWLGRQTAGMVWFLAGATYGALMMAWVIHR